MLRIFQSKKWRCVAVCCSVLQSVAVCCSVLQSVVECCSVMQCVAGVAVRPFLYVADFSTQEVAVCCSVLQCIAECCSVLQCVAECCSMLQCDNVCLSQNVAARQSLCDAHTFFLLRNDSFVDGYCSTLLLMGTAALYRICSTGLR